MPSMLDRRFDAVADGFTGPGGLLEAASDERGLRFVPGLPATVPGYFDLTCAMNGAVTAVIAGDERLTFAELNGLADGAARALVGAHGVRPGDRVGIAMRNAPAWIVAYMAVLKAGGIATLINGWWQRHELAHALALAEPTLVIADAARAARVAETGFAGAVLTLPIERELSEALAPIGDAPDGTVLPTVSPDDDATILFTSGSTGEAKGAVSTHRALTTAVYNMAALVAPMKAMMEADGQGDKVAHPVALLSVPFFHVTGEVPLLLGSFVIGRAMVLMHKWDAGEALRLIQAHRITYFLGVPTMSLELLTHPDRERFDLSTLNDLGAGGAPRPVAHVERLVREMSPAQPALGYGLTETNAVGCSNFWSNYAEKPESTGRAQPFVQVGIMDDDGSPVRQGERGEVAIRSLANVRGYWRNEAATAKAFTPDGWFLTGDIGYLDEDGYLFIVDRKKDIIIRGGENISCQEVEAAIYAHPAVAEACVFGLPDERLGEVPGAVVHLEPGEAVDEADLRGFLADKLAAYKQPVALWYEAAALPKLGTGKIDKVGLRAKYRVEA